MGFFKCGNSILTLRQHALEGAIDLSFNPRRDTNPGPYLSFNPRRDTNAWSPTYQFNPRRDTNAWSLPCFITAGTAVKMV